jgi:hypothetical protein
MEYDYSDLVENCSVEELQGKKLTALEEHGGDLRFMMGDGSVYEMGYIPDCCASCDIESGLDDLKSLVGQKLIKVTEDTSHDTPTGVKQDYVPESQTWTFYTFRTNKATAQLRWFGLVERLLLRKRHLPPPQRA